MSGGNPYQRQQGPQPQQPAGYPAQPGYPPQPGQYAPQQPGYTQQGSGYTPYGSSQVPPGMVPQTGGLNLPPEAFGGFWIRFVAVFLDGLILMIPNAIITTIIFVAFGFPPLAQFDFSMAASRGQDTQYQLANNLGTVVSILVYWLYFATMHSSKGASLGKLALGLRVVDQNGMYPGFGRATGRYFSTIISTCTICIGYIVAGFHPQKRSLHDLIAGTWVVRKEYINPAQMHMAQQGQY